ncbi:MAG: hypothetical protein FJZ80_04415 [Bacteroidetes bacterium]|nr:hypothetical protein [Bacteroidota bacterium]
MRTSLGVFLFLFATLFLSGCSKEPGIGGRAKITGKLIGKFYSDDQLTQFAGLDVLGDERVYLVYGNEKTQYDDDVRTTYDGTFEFKYLRPGKYVVFMYENCYPCASLQQEKLFEVEITDKDEVADLGEITLNKKQ